MRCFAQCSKVFSFFKPDTEDATLLSRSRWFGSSTKPSRVPKPVIDFAVLFDLEDTLVKTPWSDRGHVFEFRRMTREKLLTLGIPPEVLEGVERATLMRNMSSAFIERNFDDARVNRFN